MQSKTAETSYNPAYKRSVGNITSNWLKLLFHIVLYAAATLVLELIDKDKR